MQLQLGRGGGYRATWGYICSCSWGGEGGIGRPGDTYAVAGNRLNPCSRTCNCLEPVMSQYTHN